MKVKFLADASLNLAIVSGVVRAWPSIDFLTASSARVAGVPGIQGGAVVTQRAEAIESLVLVWLASESREWVKRICRLPF